MNKQLKLVCKVHASTRPIYDIIPSAFQIKCFIKEHVALGAVAYETSFSGSHLLSTNHYCKILSTTLVSYPTLTQIIQKD
jgi:hypothetical protein